jgi:hypothetical protein
MRAAGLAVFAGLATSLALSTRPHTGPARPPRPAAATVVVLDVSGSIDARASTTIEHTLRAVAAQGGRAGLVLFSDTAAEIVPPTAPARSLLAYVRLFRQPRTSAPFHNPWSGTFSGGTAIGRGLQAGRLALRRARIRHGRLILVSDFDDSVSDLALMRRELRGDARRPGIELRVAGVPGYDHATARLYRRVLGRAAFAVGHPPPQTLSLAPARRGRSFPTAAVVLAAAGALMLAAFELVAAPLAWSLAPAQPRATRVGRPSHVTALGTPERT